MFFFLRFASQNCVNTDKILYIKKFCNENCTTIFPFFLFYKNYTIITMIKDIHQKGEKAAISKPLIHTIPTFNLAPVKSVTAPDFHSTIY